jgi:hypothetical protein
MNLPGLDDAVALTVEGFDYDSKKLAEIVANVLEASGFVVKYVTLLPLHLGFLETHIVPVWELDEELADIIARIVALSTEDERLTVRVEGWQEKRI